MVRRLTPWGAAVLTTVLTACNFDGTGVQLDQDDGGSLADAHEEPPVDAMAGDAPAPDATPPDATPPDAAPPDAAPPECPAAFQPLPDLDNGSVYRVFDPDGFATEPTWLEGEVFCENQGPGTHLAVIDSAVENAAITTILPGDIGDDHVWIGVTDIVDEGTFLPVTSDEDAISFENFAMSEPNDIGGEDCVEIASDGLWNDKNCGDRRAIICECDGIAAVPESYTPESD